MTRAQPANSCHPLEVAFGNRHRSGAAQIITIHSKLINQLFFSPDYLINQLSFLQTPITWPNGPKLLFCCQATLLMNTLLVIDTYASGLGVHSNEPVEAGGLWSSIWGYYET